MKVLISRRVHTDKAYLLPTSGVSPSKLPLANPFTEFTLSYAGKKCVFSNCSNIFYSTVYQAGKQVKIKNHEYAYGQINLPETAQDQSGTASEKCHKEALKQCDLLAGAAIFADIQSTDPSFDRDAINILVTRFAQFFTDGATGQCFQQLALCWLGGATFTFMLP